MNDAQVLAMVKEALFEVAPNRKEEFDEISLDDTIEDLALDSIATMEMVGFLEDKTEKIFPDEELAKVNTVGDLANLVRHGRL
jgi:acyl carrier protein